MSPTFIKGDPAASEPEDGTTIVYDGEKGAYVPGPAPGGGEGGGVTVHNNLTGRSTANAHPISAITNLQNALDGKQAAGSYATGAQGALADTAVQPGDLGTAATTDATDYATAAQGDLADTAVQPGDLSTVATTGSYNDLADKPTAPGGPEWGNITGTLSAQTDLQNALDGKQAAGSYATAAQGAKADTAVQPAAIADFITAAEIPAAPTWGTIDGKPAVIAAGTTQANARSAIGAGTSNVTVGTGASNAKAGNWTPASDEIPATHAAMVLSPTSARPNVNGPVMWVNYPTQPGNAINGDLWLQPVED